jgi:hypothetical protein
VDTKPPAKIQQGYDAVKWYVQSNPQRYLRWSNWCNLQHTIRNSPSFATLDSSWKVTSEMKSSPRWWHIKHKKESRRFRTKFKYIHSQWPVIAYLAPGCLYIASVHYLYLLLHPGVSQCPLLGKFAMRVHSQICIILAESMCRRHWQHQETCSC